MDTVYVVMASFEDDDGDPELWPVAVYAEESLASEHVRRAESWACAWVEANPLAYVHGGVQEVWYQEPDGLPNPLRRVDRVSVNNPWDIGYTCSGKYNNTHYYVLAVPMRTTLPVVD